MVDCFISMTCSSLVHYSGIGSPERSCRSGTSPLLSSTTCTLLLITLTYATLQICFSQLCSLQNSLDVFARCLPQPSPIKAPNSPDHTVEVETTIVIHDICNAELRWLPLWGALSDV